MSRKVVHVIGTGTIGEPLIGLLCDFKEDLGIDEVSFHKNTPLTTDRSKVKTYFFETEAHVFISEDGNLTTTIHQENEFLITQRLIIQPYFELNLSMQDVQDLEIGSGLTVEEFGLQTRYEYTRKFSPYIDIKYERKYGETSIIAQKNNKKNEDFMVGFGIRLMF